MSWFLKGDYYENCSCTNACPCTWSSMSVPATNDYCRANLAFKVSEGEVNGINMSGLVFVMIIDSPPLMSDGNWKVGVVVNESTTDEQMGALGAVMSGDIGGAGAMLKDMSGEMLGMERHPVSIDAKEVPSGLTGSATTMSKYPEKNSEASESFNAFMDFNKASLKLSKSDIEPSLGSAFKESATNK